MATAQDIAAQGATRCQPCGLTEAEVRDRVARGYVNNDVNLKSKPIPLIVIGHVFTLFNVVNAALALLVIYTGQYRNLLFLTVVCANLIIGIAQEIRSKWAVDRLSVLAERPVRVRREGVEREISLEEIVLDDLVLLRHGDQVPADAKVLEGICSMNESLLTGESDAIPKREGDTLMSGSFVDSGSCIAQVTHVGQEGYAGKINAQAQYIKRVNSEIMTTLEHIIRFATYLLVPVGVGLFLRTMSTGHCVTDSILTTVSALAGMIPQGLILLTSMVLAVSTLRLARRSVLVQQLYCIETLARVDVLCLDKTGTITSGHMQVDGLFDAEGGTDEARVARVAHVFSTVTHALKDDANETAAALLAYAREHALVPEETVRAVPFSSARKFSGCVTRSGEAFVLGAPQFVLKERFAEVETLVRSFGRMARVLVAARIEGFDDEGNMQGMPTVFGYVVLGDEIRASAEQTIAFFKEQGVRLLVISGDDPVTVSAIAEQVGIDDACQWVDATTLTTEGKVFDAVERYRVFGRVTPEQKRSFVQALKAHGHTVAMTGDGVNDVLALKEADCSVAMAAGSDAARTVSEIVLVDNDFAHMPEVVAEGRRSINNLQRSASLFLVKTLYSALVSIVCIVAPPYPFLPVQMALLSAVIIGVPSFFLALEPNHERVRGEFLFNVLSRSAPASLIISIGISIIIVVARSLGYTAAEVSTVVTMFTAAIGIALIVMISRPLNSFRMALVWMCGLLALCGCTLFAWFFEVAALTLVTALLLMILAAIGIVFFVRLFTVTTGPDFKETRVGKCVRKLDMRR